MILRFLAWLAARILAHPGRVMAATVAPALLLAAYGTTVPADLSFAGVMDRSHPEIDRYFSAQERWKLGGLLPLLLEGPEDELDDAAAAVADALRANELVRRVDYQLPEAWLKANAPYLVDEETFERWVGLATRPDDKAGAEALRSRLEATRAEIERLRPEGVRVVMVTLVDDPMSYDTGGGTYFELEALTRETLEPFGVEGNYAGLAAVGAQDQQRTLSKVRLLTPLSLLLVLLLFRLVERSVLRLALIALPMILTVGATLGLAGGVLGEITILESFFGVMVFGLGIDFSLHLMVRLREERGAGAPFGQALTTTMTGAGRGIVAGALTTAGAFSVIALAPDPLARHLGLSGALGLLLCLALTLTVLPAGWTFLERTQTRLHVPALTVYLPVVRALSAHAVRRPWLHVGVAVGLFAFALAGVPRFTFETDLTRVVNRQVPAVEAMGRLQAISGLNAAPWIAATEDLDEARRIARSFEELDIISTVESVPTLLPADGAARQGELRRSLDEIRAQRKTYDALIPLMTEAEAEQLKGAVTLLETLEEAAQRAPPTAEDLPETLRGRLVAPTGEYLILGYAKEPSFDGRKLQAEREAMQAVWPETTGFNAVIEGVTSADRPWAIPIFFGILAFVLIVLSFDLRDPRMVLLALTPVLLGTAVTFGVLCWLGRPFSIMSTMVVPLIIGLGVDDGIHVVHRLKEDRRLPPEVGAGQVGKAIVMTTATTCLSFGVLMFTDHVGMEGMSLIMLIGLPICLLASITTLPALARLLGVNQPAEEEAVSSPSSL